MKAVVLLLVIASVFPLRCSNSKQKVEQPPAIATAAAPSHIRLKNNSSFDFDNVRVVFPSQEEQFGSLARGEATPYRVIQRAYGYAYIEVSIKDVNYILQPADYSGEVPLGQGKFTYELRFDTAAKAIILNLVKDE